MSNTRIANDLRHQPTCYQSRGEELANAISHGVGFVGALVGAPLLIAAAIQRGSTAFVVGTIVFSATILFLYFGSTLYHFWPQRPGKRGLQIVDHAAIFLLIAGTYTPFTLGPLRGAWGWTLFGLIWGLAIFGVLLKSISGVRRPKLSLALYLGMGWLIVVAIRPLMQAVEFPTLAWLFGGGGIYTLGVIFFINDKKRYCHFVWHLFVLCGTACHYCAVLSYAT